MEKALTAAQMAELSCQISHIVRRHCPYDTGNLRYNAIQIFFDNDKIVLEVNDAIAPYMPYTNEPWVAKRWHGKKNPNQNWFDKAFFEVLAHIASMFQGSTISRSDDTSMTLETIDDLASKFNVRSEDILRNSEYLSDIQYTDLYRDEKTGEYEINYPRDVIPSSVKRRIR